MITVFRKYTRFVGASTIEQLSNEINKMIGEEFEPDEFTNSRFVDAKIFPTDDGYEGILIFELG